MTFSDIRLSTTALPDRRKQWNNFKGCRQKNPNPLTPEQEKIRNELWARWAREGRSMTLGRWNMASCCARNLTAYKRDAAWSRKMSAYKWSKRFKPRYIDPETGKPSWGADADKRMRENWDRAKERLKAYQEQKRREKKGEPLKHFIPGGL